MSDSKFDAGVHSMKDYVSKSIQCSQELLQLWPYIYFEGRLRVYMQMTMAILVDTENGFELVYLGATINILASVLTNA